jgi:hypothetical protein
MSKSLQPALPKPHAVAPPPHTHTQVESLKASRAAAKGNPYLEYALDKQLAFVSDPANIAFEELELPQLIQVGVDNDDTKVQQAFESQADTPGAEGMQAKHVCVWGGGKWSGVAESHMEAQGCSMSHVKWCWPSCTSGIACSQVPPAVHLLTSRLVC